MEKAPEFRLEIHINPQCIYIESELELSLIHIYGRQVRECNILLQEEKWMT